MKIAFFFKELFAFFIKNSDFAKFQGPTKKYNNVIKKC